MDSIFAFWRKRFEFNDFTLFHIASLKLINLNSLKVSRFVWIAKERYWSHCLLRWRPEAHDRWIKSHAEFQVCENITVLCYEIKYYQYAFQLLLFFLSICYLPIVANLSDDSLTTRGAISYLVNDVIGSLVLNFYRGQFLFTLLLYKYIGSRLLSGERYYKPVPLSESRCSSSLVLRAIQYHITLPKGDDKFDSFFRAVVLWGRTRTGEK